MKQLIGNGKSNIYFTRSFTPQPTQEEQKPLKVYVLQIHPFSGWGNARKRKGDPSVRVQIRLNPDHQTPHFIILKVEEVVAEKGKKDETILQAGLVLQRYLNDFYGGLLEGL